MIWTERAEIDLEEIWRFTRERWDEEQADQYIVQLNRAVADRRTRKLGSRPIDFVEKGLLRMRQVRHFIYFRMIDADVLVMRILHDTMDETLHLP